MMLRGWQRHPSTDTDIAFLLYRFHQIYQYIDALANIEQYAIDLAWDIIARFADVEIEGQRLPVEFFLDWAKVAEDEAKHFSLLSKRLVVSTSLDLHCFSEGRVERCWSLSVAKQPVWRVALRQSSRRGRRAPICLGDY